MIDAAKSLELLRLRDAAYLLKVHPRLLPQLLADKKIDIVHLSERRKRVPLAQIERMLAQSVAAPRMNKESRVAAR